MAGSLLRTRASLRALAGLTVFALLGAASPAPAAADSAPPACVNVSRWNTLQPPAAAFGAAPNPATTRGPVVFDGSCSTGENPDGIARSEPADTWSWTFGDGSTATGPRPTHTYAQPGTYTVTLTECACGQHSPQQFSVSHEIEVKDTSIVESTIATVENAVKNPPKSTIGGGEAHGSVTFSGSGVPPAGSPCAATSFALNGDAASFALNTVITGYAGPVTLAGNGSSSCESATAGSGTLTLTTVKGTGPTGSELNCADPAAGTTLAGSYSRAGIAVQAVLGGTCKVNGFDAKVSFVFHGEFVPTDTGGGLTSPIIHADFVGAFAASPA